MTESNQTSDSTNNEWKEREIGALWKREGKNQRYLSGKLTIGEFGVEKTINVVVFVNRYKEKENQPDFRIYEDRPREEGAATAPAKEAKEATEVAEAAEEVDSDLPAVLQ